MLKYYELKISSSQFCREFNAKKTAIVRWNIKYEVGSPSASKRIKIRIKRIIILYLVKKRIIKIKTRKLN
ncbi:MAG: hypothetical protein ACRC6A_12465, partial [Fusobacteriaceae bacterium]